MIFGCVLVGWFVVLLVLVLIRFMFAFITVVDLGFVCLVCVVVRFVVGVWC